MVPVRTYQQSDVEPMEHGRGTADLYTRLKQLQRHLEFLDIQVRSGKRGSRRSYDDVWPRPDFRTVRSHACPWVCLDEPVSHALTSRAAVIFPCRRSTSVDETPCLCPPSNPTV
jgi:hypothetical protein